MPANLLNLREYEITRLDENDHDYHVWAEVKQPPTACLYCRSDNLVGFGRREQLIKDLPMHGKRVGLYVNARRMQCRTCDRTFTELLPAVDEKRAMTTRLLAWIGKASVSRTFASIAEEIGIAEGTVRSIFRSYVSELERTIRFETPKWMGIDEIHLIRPRCVISNIRNNTIVNLLPNRDKKTVTAYLSCLDGRQDVQYVAMDMWTPYRDAVRTVMPQARIIIDKFHVVRMANDAIERVRKALRSDLTVSQRRGLMHDRFLLLKRQRDLDERERLLLDGWVKNYPLLGVAYRLKEAFYGCYDAKSAPEAEHVFSRWLDSVPAALREPFGDLIRAYSNWNAYILNYFEHPVTNAYTESLNNLIRVMNRLGRGYSFEALRAKILFTEGMHKHTNSRPKFARIREAPRERTLDLMIYEKALPFHRPKEPQPIRVGTPKNYGVDISTLIAKLEAGDL